MRIIKGFYTTFILFLVISASGQDTTYLDDNRYPINSLDSAVYIQYDVFNEDSTMGTRHIIKADGTEYEVAQFKNLYGVTYHGKYIQYRYGKKYMEIDYFNGKIDGSLITYYPHDALIRRYELHEKGTLVAGICFDPMGRRTYFPLHTNAQYPGGEEAMYLYILKHLRTLKNAGSLGKVYVSFIVLETGEMSDIKIIRGGDSLYEEDIVGIFKRMPKWKPAQVDGVPIKSEFVLPINID